VENHQKLRKHHFFSKVISGIETVAAQKGYNVIIALSNESFDKEVINMEMLANGSIDGFILSLSKETLMQQDYHHLNETINQGMPIVMFDRVVKDVNCDKVIVDDLKGTRKAVEKLIENGCKEIGIISTKDYVSVGKLRTQGYLQALNNYNLEPKSSLILKVDDRLISEEHLTEIETEIEELFNNNPKMDGIFAVNELYAVTAMKVAKKLKKKIPDEIQVVGFTDGVISRHAMPSLTTVSQHALQMGGKAAELLIEKLETEDEEDIFKTIIIETELIERESTK